MISPSTTILENVVADALSRKSSGMVAHLMIKEWQLLERIRDLDLDMQMGCNEVVFANLLMQPVLIQRT